ncbi:MAG TPA: hypothetical protein VN924_06695 [Bryobacteraceae bacterium]|nr:hypothetical protein [Bryobacteraceae bacterium]
MPGFLVDDPDYRLPHPQIPLRLILVAHLALTKAFELLRAQPPIGFALSTAKEDEITIELYRVLEDRLLGAGAVPGFDRRRFRNVVRAPEIPNFDGTHPAKKPDLVAFLVAREHLSVRPSQDALFAECKPVDDSHPIGKHYCDGGIQRFVNGEYAWAMQEGMMIAYVRGRRTINTHLAPVLASENRRSALGTAGAPEVVFSAIGSGEALQFTIHQRSFQWPGGHGKAGEIQIFHSWHPCA